MKQTQVAYIGIDVSKETLDIDAGVLGAMKINNAPAEIRKALKAIARKVGADATPRFCFESTGPYGNALAAQCHAAGLRCSVLNPYKVACFAKSVANAKTDRIDAALIRRYAEARRPEPAAAPNKALAEVEKLVLTRDALVKCSVILRAVMDTLRGSAGARVMEGVIAFLERKADKYKELIEAAVEKDEEAAGLVKALRKVKGVGALTAAAVAAGMPEIGTLGRRKAAALAGLAPYVRESGMYKGMARIGGGRKRVRTALFMPATVAIQHDPMMKALHQREIAKGKPYKVALTAAMRRLLCRLESVAKEHLAKRGQEPKGLSMNN